MGFEQKWGFMSAWAPELLFEASRPTHCVLNESGSFWIVRGASECERVDAMAGKWNLFVPHARADWVDPLVDFCSLGFCLVHECWRPSWQTDGAFGCRGLTVQTKVLTVDCSTYVLVIGDGDLVKERVAAGADSSMDAREQTLLNRFVCESLSILGYEMAVEQRRRRQHTSTIDYVHSSKRLMALAANRATAREVSLHCSLLGKTVVKMEAEWSLPPERAKSVRLAGMRLSPALVDWIETGAGRAIFPKGIASVAEALSSDAVEEDEPAPKRVAPEPDEALVSFPSRTVSPRPS
jgi:hypothetical protein